MLGQDATPTNPSSSSFILLDINYNILSSYTLCSWYYFYKTNFKYQRFLYRQMQNINLATNAPLEGLVYSRTEHTLRASDGCQPYDVWLNCLYVFLGLNISMESVQAPKVWACKKARIMAFYTRLNTISGLVVFSITVILGVPSDKSAFHRRFECFALFFGT